MDWKPCGLPQAVTTKQPKRTKKRQKKKVKPKDCLLHGRDICLPSQASVLFPRSRQPSSKQKLLSNRSQRKKKTSRFQSLPLNCTLVALFCPAFKSSGVEGAQGAVMKDQRMKDRRMKDRRTKLVWCSACSTALAEGNSVKRKMTDRFYLSYQSRIDQPAAL